MLRMFFALLVLALPAQASPTAPEVFDRSTTVADSSAEILASSTLRRYLLIQNISSVNLGVNTANGTAAIGTAGTVTLFPGGSIEFTGKDVPQNAMKGICASGTCQITIIEVR